MTSTPSRVLFVGRTIAHFSYYESIIAALLERGATVDYATDEQWSSKWAGGDQSIREFSDRYPGLKSSALVRRSDEHRDRIFAMRELRSYRSYLVREHTTPFYVQRWRAYLTEAQRKKYDQAEHEKLLKSPFADIALRWEEARTPSDPGIVDYIRAKAPDAMILTPTNMRFSEETDYLKAARKLGIPTAVPVLSWDNLSTKGLVQIAPDKLFVWNEFQYDDAVRIQKMPRSRVEVAGAPFFDKWFDPAEDTVSREAFCRTLGLDPEKKILLYLGSSRNIAKDESWFVEEVAGLLASASHPDLAGFQILVRPHPANAAIYKRLIEAGICVFPQDGALPETRQDFADMRNTFLHASAALGINTSGMIDAVLADLPTFSVRLEQYAQTQADSKHFRYLEDGDALYLTDSLEGFAQTLARTARGEDPKAGSRQAFAKRFARPRGLDRSAGDVIAEAVLKMARPYRG